MADFVTIHPDGRLEMHMHPGQRRAWESLKRFIVILAGSQGGKTIFTPYWLYREITLRGPGDYLYVSPSFQLLKKKALPEFLALFESRLRLGTYNQSDKIFTFSPAGHERAFPGHPHGVPTKVFFGHADDPESLESATAKAAVLDEAGQKRFRLGSWEAIQRRLAVNQGRCLIATTPYDLGWLKTHLYDEWIKANKSHPEIDVIRFDSTENPTFPRAEFERQRRKLPSWKFDMFFRGIFTRVAGLIYDCFDAKRMTWPALTRIDARWCRRIGLDFGTANTAAVFFAEEQSREGLPTGRWIAYREHRPGQRLTPEEHCEALLEGEPRTPDAWGGSRSEDGWRERFRMAGLPVREPAQAAVEPGIDAVYSLIKSGNLIVLDHLSGLLDELASYSRELDPDGEPTDKIEDQNSYHLLDCCRYALGGIASGEGMGAFDPYPKGSESIMARIPSGVFIDTSRGRDRGDIRRDDDSDSPIGMGGSGGGFGFGDGPPGGW